MGRLAKLLEGDKAVIGLLRTNPFPDSPPRWVRARYYEYHFTTPAERATSGQWWSRRELGLYVPPVALRAR